MIDPDWRSDIAAGNAGHTTKLRRGQTGHAEVSVSGKSDPRGLRNAQQIASTIIIPAK
jgi:hypothetical protein